MNKNESLNVAHSCFKPEPSKSVVLRLVTNALYTTFNIFVNVITRNYSTNYSTRNYSTNYSTRNYSTVLVDQR